MFSFFKRKQGGNRCLGVSFHPDGVSLALAAKDRNQDIVLEHLEFQPIADGSESGETLKKMVAKAGLKGMPTVVVLQPLNYSLMQVETPEVTPEELTNAVRWRIKDLIDFHIDDAVIDLIPLPQSKRVGAPKLMYVIAAKSSHIESVVEQIENAGLDLKAIDISELALRNLTYADVQENRANAFLYLSKKLSLIEVCDNGVLCLSRHISLDTGQLDENMIERRVELLDMLALEVQRSLDYYESQFANGAASQLNLVSQCSASVEEFDEVAGSYLTVPIKGLSALNSIKGLDKFEEELVASNLPSVGGAIRDFAWTA